MEFSFSMSKNLLKTISNLSLEVMNLNQTTFRGIFLILSMFNYFLGEVYNYEKTK